jgi:hypothetical protein
MEYYYLYTQTRMRKQCDGEEREGLLSSEYTTICHKVLSEGKM